MDESNIINTEGIFGSFVPREVKLLSLDEILDLGIDVRESEGTMEVSVPLKAQHRLIEHVKSHGFGAVDALDTLTRGMLRRIGFVEDIQFRVDPQTFDWIARESSKTEAGGPGDPDPGVPTPISSDSSEEKVAHKSGATSSHFSPFNFYNRFEGVKLTCQRFIAGNRKHEAGTTVYDEMNWLKALAARDIAFFRDRAGHAVEHLIAEMHGTDDADPGGNLGAVGWFVEVFAYVKKHDPFFYACIQGKHHLNDTKAEELYQVA